MENNIPTAEELLANNVDGLKDFINDNDIFEFYKGVIQEYAKEYAKLHVQAALLQASENADITYTEEKTWDFTFVDKKSILNAYPLNNIK